MTTIIKKSGKIFSDGTQAFNVPNNEEGKAFIKALRKFSNPKKKNEFACRGRGSRKEFAKRVGRFTAQSFLPLTDAEWFAVYMDSNAESRQALVSKLYSQNTKLYSQNSKLEAELKLWKGGMGDGDGMVGKLQAEIVRIENVANGKITELQKILQENADLKNQIVSYQTRNFYLANKVDHTDEIQKLRDENRTLQTSNIQLNQENQRVKNNVIKDSVGRLAIQSSVPVVKVEGITITVPIGTRINVVQG